MMQIEIPRFLPVIRSAVKVYRGDECPFIVIRGDNGSGKSTLFKLLVGLLRTEARPVVSLADREYYPTEDRGCLLYMPQVPDDAFFTRMSVYDNVTLLTRLLGIGDAPYRVLMKGHSYEPLWRLSVGEKKSLLLRMLMDALSRRGCGRGAPPTVVLLDEPFAGLDHAKRAELFAEVTRAASSHAQHENVVFVLVDHAFTVPEAARSTFRFQVRHDVELQAICAPSIRVKHA